MKRTIGQEDKLSPILAIVTLALALGGQHILPQQITIQMQGHSYGPVTFGRLLSMVIGIAVVGFIAGEAWLESALARPKISSFHIKDKKMLLELHNVGQAPAKDVKVYLRSIIRSDGSVPDAFTCPIKLGYPSALSIDADCKRSVELFQTYLKDEIEVGIIFDGTDATGQTAGFQFLFGIGREWSHEMPPTPIYINLMITTEGKKTISRWYRLKASMKGKILCEIAPARKPRHALALAAEHGKSKNA